jgi:hypothetical protein
MANYTFLSITAYGIQENINNFDANSPKPDGPKIEIKSDGNNRIITSEFKSCMTSNFTNEITSNIKELSLLIEIEIEPGYSALFHKSAYQTKPIKIFEINDFRDDGYLKYLNQKYLDKFDKIQPHGTLIEILNKSITGKIYLNLLSNPNYYINI